MDIFDMIQNKILEKAGLNKEENEEVEKNTKEKPKKNK